MPITQDQMLEQVRESRENHRAWQQIHAAVFAYTNRAKALYPNNKELQESLTALEFAIKSIPQPSHHVTYVNEQYYARFGRKNDRARKRQEYARRNAGIPTLAEQHLAAAEQRSYAATRAFRNKPAQPHVSRAPIIPDDTHEPPLEFDTPIASPGDIHNNFAMGLGLGLDTTSQDDTLPIGNPAKSADGNQ